MGKGTHFIGQPMYGQLISLIDKSKVLGSSREKGGKRYVKHFDAWQHLVAMLYAVIKRFDVLREIADPMFPEARKLSPLGIGMMPGANAIKIQIWVTLIANLPLIVIQKRIKRTWSFSGLAPYSGLCSYTTSTTTPSSRNPKRTSLRYSRQRTPHPYS